GARRHGGAGPHAGPRHSPDPTRWDMGRVHPDGAGGDRARSGRDRRHRTDRLGRHHSHVRVHARVRAGLAGRARVPEPNRRVQPSGDGPWGDWHAQHGLRLLGQLAAAVHPWRPFHSAQRGPAVAAVHLPCLGRRGRGLVPRRPSPQPRNRTAGRQPLREDRITFRGGGTRPPPRLRTTAYTWLAPSFAMMGMTDRHIRRLNLILDSERADKLARLAETVRMREETLARLLLWQALDEADRDPGHVAELVNAIPGPHERAQLALKQVAAGYMAAIDNL